MCNGPLLCWVNRRIDSVWSLFLCASGAILGRSETQECAFYNVSWEKDGTNQSGIESCPGGKTSDDTVSPPGRTAQEPSRWSSRAAGWTTSTATTGTLDSCLDACVFCSEQMMTCVCVCVCAAASVWSVRRIQTSSSAAARETCATRSFSTVQRWFRVSNTHFRALRHKHTQIFSVRLLGLEIK